MRTCTSFVLSELIIVVCAWKVRVYLLARMFWEWDICDALDILYALGGFAFHQPLLPSGLVNDEPPVKSEVSIEHKCPGFLFFTSTD